MGALCNASQVVAARLRGPLRRSGWRIGTLFENRPLDAFAKSLMCFAVIHEILLVIHLAKHGDLSVLNVFTMLEAQRLFSELGTGLGSQILSAVFALAVYSLVFAFLTRPRGIARTIAADEAETYGVDFLRRGRRATEQSRSWLSVVRTKTFRPSIRGAVPVLVAGLAVHMACLAWIERLVPMFPSIPDVLQSRLPYVDFGVPGELYFVGFLVAVAVVHFRSQVRTVPAVVVQLGLFYALRGCFLFFLPIGSPDTAPALTSRFVLYPFANHAYFPGGHVGLMTILSLSVRHPGWRRALLAATALFAFGTILARTHYTADALGGFLVAYAIVSWGRRHLEAPTLRTVPGPLPISLQPRDRRFSYEETISPSR